RRGPGSEFLAHHPGGFTPERLANRETNGASSSFTSHRGLWIATQTMDRNLFRALTISATFQCLAQTPEPFEVRRAEAAFEELPELKASEILKPELLKGPHYVVRDPVPTGSGMNLFTIDSDFGVFEADGNEMLLQRLKEIDAIARLQEVSRTDEFKKSLVAAAKSPL